MQRLALPADRQEKIDEISRSIMHSFQREYLAEYTGLLMAELKSEVEATDGLLAGSQSLNKLQRRTSWMSADVTLYGGWLTKLGAVRKNWKRRWFAIAPDYTITYYANERDRQPRGSMMLQGYEVRPDCFKGEKDLCIELHHRSRRCFYVYADSREDYEQWIPILKEVCRKSRFHMHPDPLRARAFDVAFKSTQRAMEDDTDRMPELSETEALVQLICDRIDAVVLSDTEFFADSGRIQSATAASGLQLSRRFASFTSKKLVLATALSVVAATLQAVHDTADHLRHRLKSDLRSVWPEFTHLEDDLNERIEEAVLPVVAPTLNRMVKPSVRRILNVIVPIIAEAHLKALTIFYESSMRAVDEIMSSGMDCAMEILSRLSRSVAGTLRYRDHPLHCVVILVEPSLHRLFNEGVTAVLEEDSVQVKPDAIADAMLAAVQQVTDKAVFLLEESINDYHQLHRQLQPLQSDLNQLRQKAVDALHFDCHASMATLIGTVTKEMVLPPFLELVQPAAEDLVSKHVAHRCKRQVNQLERTWTERNQPTEVHLVAPPAPERVRRSAISQTLDIRKLTKDKLISLAAEPIETLAVASCVSPLLASRGGGECSICQAKVQKAALEELKPKTEAAAEPKSVVEGSYNSHGASGWGWEGFREELEDAEGHADDGGARSQPNIGPDSVGAGIGPDDGPGARAAAMGHSQHHQQRAATSAVGAGGVYTFLPEETLQAPTALAPYYAMFN